MEWDDRWDNAFYYNSNEEYIMTESGLESVRKIENERRKKSENNEGENGKQPGNSQGPKQEGGKYRYQNNKPKKDSTNIRKDSSKTVVGITTKNDKNKDNRRDLVNAPDAPTPLYNLLMVFQ